MEDRTQEMTRYPLSFVRFARDFRAAMARENRAGEIFRRPCPLRGILALIVLTVRAERSNSIEGLRPSTAVVRRAMAVGVATRSVTHAYGAGPGTVEQRCMEREDRAGGKRSQPCSFDFACREYCG